MARKSPRKLRPQDLRREKFKVRYVENGGNGTEAVMYAGFTQNKKSAGRMATTLLNEPEIKAWVELTRQKIANDLGLTRDWVLMQLKECYERCMDKTPVLDAEGNETGEWKFDSRGALKALELIGKEHGMFVERREDTVHVYLADEIAKARQRRVGGR